jgi:hypothetical protein
VTAHFLGHGGHTLVSLFLDHGLNPRLGFSLSLPLGVGLHPGVRGSQWRTYPGILNQRHSLNRSNLRQVQWGEIPSEGASLVPCVVIRLLHSKHLGVQLHMP